MRSVSGFIDDLGGATSVAALLNLPPTTVASWKQRGSIPVTHWPRLVAAAEDKALKDFSYELLVAMHSPATPASEPERVAS